jgi:hypothetical protein
MTQNVISLAECSRKLEKNVYSALLDENENYIKLIDEVVEFSYILFAFMPA